MANITIVLLFLSSLVSMSPQNPPVYRSGKTSFGKQAVFTFGQEIRIKRQTLEPTPEECEKPPMTKHGHECCRLPEEKIWGDLRRSFRMCFKRVKQGAKGMATGMGDDVSDVKMPDGMMHGRPGGKKPHHFRRHGNDSCFMECVFEDQGFLLNKMVSKDALLIRFKETLEMNAPWHRAAVAAVEVCLGPDSISPSPNQNCTSGSEEVFRCIFKQLFFNCPNWSQSNHCTTLREFYRKCPNGPPPELEDSHPATPASAPTSAMPEELDMNPTTETIETSQSES